ncbi:hypothetical protein FY036_06335 [Mesorhizobium microcysteis]|uniref:Uncharacterized protein n=1 Tax=Neoaquamicrobium microcysteis TaxID=2682781 RepID=A0A5D4H039_9HYPH|nr:hypothetical protein [Mesorhizobium microcysteis]TYR33672.1 hypothetical protein FY036_06335 [Mesorhizobium microcysteis]
MTARQHFDRQFAHDNLREIFKERIAHTATTGKDGVSPDAFEGMIDTELSLALTKVRSGTYRFTTYRQKLVLKGAGKVACLLKSGPP